MKTDTVLDDELTSWDVRRTRQAVVPLDRRGCHDAVVEDDAFREPLPGVPGQWTEPWPSRRLRGAVGDVPSTVLREEEGRCYVIGAVGRRFGSGICWQAATPGAVHEMDDPRHCRLASATVTRDHQDGTLVANQVRLAWTDDGPPEAVEEAMKLALASGMQGRLDALAERNG